MTPPDSTRRDFLKLTAWAAAGAAVGIRANAQGAGEAPASPIIVFSKPFQELGPQETADLVAEIGWNGIECPVRRKGQIENDQAAEKLPRFVDAFARKGLSIPVVVSDITSLREPHAEDVLRACAKAGVKKVRLGFWKYLPGQPILPQVERVGRDLKEIGAVCRDLGIQAGVENHSGADMFGAPIWDIVEAVRGSRAESIGIFFDIGHATIEGGLSWPVQAKLAEPSYLTVYVKDFNWKKVGEHWRPRWCPLGQGMIEPAFVKNLKRSGYAGPICQHHEYPLGEKDQMIQHFREDLKTLKGWLA